MPLSALLPCPQATPKASGFLEKPGVRYGQRRADCGRTKSCAHATRNFASSIPPEQRCAEKRARSQPDTRADATSPLRSCSSEAAQLPWFTRWRTNSVVDASPSRVGKGLDAEKDDASRTPLRGRRFDSALPEGLDEIGVPTSRHSASGTNSPSAADSIGRGRSLRCIFAPPTTLTPTT